MHIREIMSKPAVTCRPNDTLNTAAQLMWEHDCGAVPVVNDEGTLVGMITDRDICMAAYTQGASLASIPVARSMAENVASCHGNDSLDSIERLMRDKQIRRVPVVDENDKPIGLVSLSDIARHTAASKKKNALDHELAQTLAAIGQPRPQHELRASTPQQLAAGA